MSVLVNGKKVQVFTDGETYLGTNEIEREEIQNANTNSSSDKVITPTEIGKVTVNTPTYQKDIAMEKVSQDIQIFSDKETKKEGEEL